LLGSLFTHDSDIEREQNVVIYLTPYIVRKSGDLQKLKQMLSELEEVQNRYNKLVQNALVEKESGGIFSSSNEVSSDAPASSRRIRRTTTSNLSILDEEY
jgi:general secretion pathway protein D